MNATPRLELTDPTTLTVDVNVRTDAPLSAGFVGSIAEHSVMEPVIATAGRRHRARAEVCRFTGVERPVPRWSSIRIRKDLAASFIQPPSELTRLPRPAGTALQEHQPGQPASGVVVVLQGRVSPGKDLQRFAAGVGMIQRNGEEMFRRPHPAEAVRAGHPVRLPGHADTRSAAPKADKASPVSRNVDHSSCGRAPRLR
jgi:hypothetical protein